MSEWPALQASLRGIPPAAATATTPSTSQRRIIASTRPSISQRTECVRVRSSCPLSVGGTPSPRRPSLGEHRPTDPRQCTRRYPGTREPREPGRSTAGTRPRAVGGRARYVKLSTNPRGAGCSLPVIFAVIFRLALFVGPTQGAKTQPRVVALTRCMLWIDWMRTAGVDRTGPSAVLLRGAARDGRQGSGQGTGGRGECTHVAPRLWLVAAAC